MCSWTEWEELMRQARDIGLTPEEVHEILERIKEENREVAE